MYQFANFTKQCISFFVKYQIIDYKLISNKLINNELINNKAYELGMQYKKYNIPKMEKLIFSKDERLSQSQSNLNNDRLILAENLNSIIKKSSARIKGIIINLQKELGINFNNFMQSYEQLTPYDKIEIMDLIKEHVNPCYHDFYNSFIPIGIMYELENKNMDVFCQFSQGCECDKCSCKCSAKLKKSICFNIKKPIYHSVSFDFNEQSIIKESNFKQLIKRITFLNWYSNEYANNFYRNVSNYPLVVHIFLSSKKKTLDWDQRNRLGDYVEQNHVNRNQRSRLGPKETNSAYCANLLDHTKIVIYREEEIIKLGIHEFMHGLGIEGSYDWNTNKQINEKINSSINIDHYCSSSSCTRIDSFNENFISGMSEGYVDFCADIINSVFNAVEMISSEGMKIPGISEKKQFEKIFNQIFNYELNFSLFQVAKILIYFGFNNYNELFEQKGDKQIYQSTNVFSYFVIRSILLFNFSDLVESLKQFPHSGFITLLALNTEQKAGVCHKFIINNLNNEKFANAINEYMKLFKTTKIPEILKNTMRRSIIELANTTQK